MPYPVKETQRAVSLATARFDCSTEGGIDNSIADAIHCLIRFRILFFGCLSTVGVDSFTRGGMDNSSFGSQSEPANKLSIGLCERRLGARNFSTAVGIANSILESAMSSD